MIDLRLGDCLDVMRGIPDASIDAVITDPPYGVGIAGWDDELPPLRLLNECLRIARGSVIWFGGAKMVLDFARYEPKPERMLIWSPAFTLNKTSKNKMFYRFHPIWCWRLPQKQDGISTDVLRDNCEGHNWWNHPATKPVDLMIKIISAFGGNTILDPFMGSGTTGVACVKLNRNFIGIEINPQYYTIAQRRIQEAQAQLAMPMVTA